jgi:lincosamide and streptogramin A transport system ATP-binding/permease protein
MSRLTEDRDETSLDRFGEIQEAFELSGGYEIDATIAAEIDAIGLAKPLLDRPFGSLSGGEQTRALIVSLFADRHCYPLIDEPTNHLDMRGREIVQAYLSQKPGFLLVSHDRHFLDGAVDHIVSINLSDTRVNRGSYSQWRKHMDEELLHEKRRRENIERDVKQLTHAATQRRRGSESREKSKYASGGGVPGQDTGYIGKRAAKQMKRAIQIERRIESQLSDKKELLRNKEKQRELRIETRDAAGESLLTLQNVTIRLAGRTLVNDLSLRVSPGDRIAITGPNGSGKTSLFNAISGELDVSDGIINRSKRVTLSRALQHPDWADGSLRDHLDETQLDETRFRQLMGVVGVSGDIFDRPLETFSQGQLKKVDLCRSLMMDADVLLWEEPLNYVDLHSREQIETAIIQYEPTLLFIEHDRAFVDAVSTRVVELTLDN